MRYYRSHLGSSYLGHHCEEYWHQKRHSNAHHGLDRFNRTCVGQCRIGATFCAACPLHNSQPATVQDPPGHGQWWQHSCWRCGLANCNLLDNIKPTFLEIWKPLKVVCWSEMACELARLNVSIEAESGEFNSQCGRKSRFLKSWFSSLVWWVGINVKICSTNAFLTKYDDC